MKKILSLLAIVLSLSLCLAVPAVAERSVTASAADGVQVTIQNSEVQQGGYVYLSLSASGVKDLSMIELALSYDPSAFEFRTASAGSLLPSDTLSESNGEEAGLVSLYALSAAGFSGDGVLWRVTLRAKDDAPVGSYPVRLLAGDCCDKSLAPVTVTTSGANITVTERPQSVQRIYIYGRSSQGELHRGDSVTVSFYSSDLYGLAAAEMGIGYDSTLLSLSDVQMGTVMTEKGQASVNSDRRGYVKISYIAMNGVQGRADPIVSLTLTALQDTDATTDVTLSMEGLCDASLAPMSASDTHVSIFLKKMPVEIIPPEIGIADVTAQGESFKVYVIAEGETHLAAGDFVVRYDPQLLLCTDAVGNQAYFTVVNNLKEEGCVKFSFIAEDGISEDTTLVTLTFEKVSDTPFDAEISLEGTDLSDADIHSITANVHGGTIHSACHIWESRSAKAATCTESGHSAYEECSVCGSRRGYVEEAAKGHKEEIIPKKEPTCTEAGSTQGSRCSVCNEILDEPHEIPANGHTMSESHGYDATCTEEGELPHFHCSACNLNFEDRAGEHPLSNIVISPKGHHYGDPTWEWNGFISATATFTCDRCEDGTDGHAKSVTENAVSGTRVEPTCVAQGAQKYSVTVHFGEQDYTTEQTEALNIDSSKHTHLTLVPQKDATCTEGGYEQYYQCDGCGRKYEDAQGGAFLAEPKPISPKGHHYGTPTWRWDHYTSATATFTCDRCEAGTNGHTMSVTENAASGERVEPTCADQGSQKYTVTVSFENQDYTTEQTETLDIDSSKHTHLSLVEKKDATCTDAGHEQYYQCDGCRNFYEDADGNTFLSEPKEIPAKGHHYGTPTWTWNNYTSATATFTCDQCNAGTEGHTKSVTENAVSGERVEPTCVAQGTQKYTITVRFEEKDYTTEQTETLDIDSNKHTHLTLVSQKDATCTEAGYEQYYQCDGCGCKYEDAQGNTSLAEPKEIPAKGHRFGEWHLVEDGKEQRSCDFCGETEERDAVSAIAERFREEVAAIGNAETGEQKFEAIKRAAETWNSMTELERKIVQDARSVLQSEIEAYNATVEEINRDHDSALGITEAIASVLAGFSSLAAAYYVGKGLYLGGIS